MNNTAKRAPEKGEVYIIFPCYNEEEGLEKLLGRFKGVRHVCDRPIHIVIVDDGSSDHTLKVAEAFLEELPIHIISFGANKGVAHVFNEAFKYVLARSGDNDIIITIDSDNTMNPYTILDLIKKIDEADVVVASRFVPGGKMVGAGYRTIFSYGASWLLKWRIGIPNLTDYSIFYRAYTRKVISEISEKYGGKPVEGGGFSCMANLLIRIFKTIPNVRFVEVPLVLRYDQKEGGSALKFGKTIRGYLDIAFSKDGSK